MIETRVYIISTITAGGDHIIVIHVVKNGIHGSKNQYDGNKLY